jgi:hypothetical protein
MKALSMEEMEAIGGGGVCDVVQIAGAHAGMGGLFLWAVGASVPPAGIAYFTVMGGASAVCTLTGY